MYTSPTLTNANECIITTRLRFPHKEILKYNFDENHNIH